MSLEIIMGPMFSGKSTELIRRIKRQQIIGKKVLVINSAKDTRFLGDFLCTHEKETLKCIKLNQLPTKINIECDIVAVDEAQFFTGLREFCEHAIAQGKKVMLAGLDGDSNMQPFGEILQVVPMANKVIKLNALCSVCGDKAPFTKRTCTEEGQELVGGSELYMATCRLHHH